MKILVTGAAGFIGFHLSERLHSLGHEVVGIDNFSPYYCVDLKKLNALDLEKQRIRVHELDLVTDKIDDVLEGVGAVFHFAAQPGISADVPLDSFIKNNINATENLYQALKNIPDLRIFVNTSTSSVYGVHAMDDENTPPKPTSYYGVTKLAAEQLILAYQRDKKFPVCSVRPFSVYGERERPDKLYPKVINSILNDVPFPFYEGSEKHLRSYTYIGDMIDGYVSILNNINKCIGEIFNLGLDSAITTGEGIKIIEDYLGKKAIYDIKPPRQGDQLETRATIEKAREILGYNPTTKPQDGLKKEVDWFKEKIWKKIDLYR
ncbi:MAG: NAD-dependent epimerase/dehydratase family protein [Patescibacteria group bacterium]|nr:NAD-dependent epimerase/dehydratase family protein [Patescibacteria group bacterium]MBU1953171.1 NAD-dependent epimerase/dehydratase family protein [Patescibacteria group bacterium]